MTGPTLNPELQHFRDALTESADVAQSLSRDLSAIAARLTPAEIAAGDAVQWIGQLAQLRSHLRSAHTLEKHLEQFADAQDVAPLPPDRIVAVSLTPAALGSPAQAHRADGTVIPLVEAPEPEDVALIAAAEPYRHEETVSADEARAILASEASESAADHSDLSPEATPLPAEPVQAAPAPADTLPLVEAPEAPQAPVPVPPLSFQGNPMVTDPTAFPADPAPAPLGGVQPV